MRRPTPSRADGRASRARAGPCTHPTLGAAEVFSLSASTLVLMAYVPQLVETWRVGGAKSLSYATTTIQALGALAVSLNYLVFQVPSAAARPSPR